MSDDDNAWVILGDVKATPTPKIKSVTVEKDGISTMSPTSLFFDAVTSKSQGDIEVTIESPISPTYEKPSTVGFSQESLNGGEKIHHLGNSTGTMISWVVIMYFYSLFSRFFLVAF